MVTKKRSKFRAKDTPWAKARIRPYGNYTRVLESAEAANFAARATAASAAINAGRCPNGCGNLGAHSSCRVCGFALHVYPAPPVDPRPTFNRRPARKGRTESF